MKIDLCKLLGVEEGEEFKRDDSKIYYKYRVHNNIIQHFDEVLKIWEYSTLSINALVASEIIKLPKKKEFSQETLNLFKLVDKTYKWVAKDMNENVYAYEEKPRKGSTYWLYGKGIKCGAISNCFNQSIFDQIHWEDEEPVCIDDYVER